MPTVPDWRTTTPARSSRRSRSASTLVPMPGSRSWSSPYGRGCLSNSWMITSDHLSPTTSSARASGQKRPYPVQGLLGIASSPQETGISAAIAAVSKMRRPEASLPSRTELHSAIGIEPAPAWVSILKS